MQKYKYEDKTIFEIETNEKGEKIIHFLGYGYLSPVDESNTPYRFLEYNSHFKLLSDVLKIGFHECEMQETYKGTYIGDCSYDDMVYEYEHYVNGNMPKVCNFLSETIEDGVYIYTA
jgi:hypothetical protein